MANIMRLGGGNAKIKIINVGSVDLSTPHNLNYGGTVTKTLDIKSKVPNYQKITKDNIIFGLTKIRAQGGDWESTTKDNHQHTINFSYNNANGIITFTSNYSSTAYMYSQAVTNVYVIEGNVERS